MLNPRLFGDESDLTFWTVASHYLQSFAQARHLSVSAAEGSEESQPSPQNHLDICQDVLCESSYFQVSKMRDGQIILPNKKIKTIVFMFQAVESPSESVQTFTVITRL